MQCAFPLRSTGGASFGCGQCMPCRINRSRKWVARLLLEGMTHHYVWFITLTYQDPPPGGSLAPRDLQLFLKRMRKDVGEGLRFFAVGEYGARTMRPHYHAILFGLDPLWLKFDGRRLSFQKSTWWPHGFVQIDEANKARFSYICHYTLKKMTKPEARELEGRHPEFMRASRRPGIGVPAVPYLAEFFSSRQGSAFLAEYGDVLGVMRHDGRVWPLDALMKGKVRAELAIPIKAEDRLPIPREINPAFREVTPEELEKAGLTHDRLRRRQKSRGSL